MRRSYWLAKRVTDLAVALPLAVASLPIQLAAAVAIRLRMGSPVLFRQRRSGVHGRPFQLVKFRTMVAPDVDHALIDDASRLTPLGSWLRSTSIDELPSLWNVLRGELSLVGPRPLPTRYLARYTPEQARRLEALPGLTGLAQVSGRNALSWDARLRIDIEYVDHRCWWLDVKILERTVSMVLRREGIHADDHATMSEFRGVSQMPDAVDAGAAERTETS